LKDLGHLGKQPDVPTNPVLIWKQMENEIRRQVTGAEEDDTVSITKLLLLQARRAERRRRRQRLLAAGKPQLP
jgi:hypothetical protein